MCKAHSRSILLLVSVIVLVSVFTVPNYASADQLNCPCKVVKVTDGDTVHVLDQATERHKVRLGGIDAPEKSQAFGRKSTKNLAGYVVGKLVEVEYNKRDRYKRIIGKLLLDGQDVNLQQVRDGYAWHYKYYQKDQTTRDRVLYGQAEDDARKVKAGLWSAPSIPPWEYRRNAKK